jgi:hypothetical protein
MADDSLYAQLDTVASSVMTKPVTMAGAATIAPTTFLTFLTGTVPIATITPPVNGAHMLAFVATSATGPTTVTTGNVILASTLITNKMLLMTYDPSSNKYYPSY